MNANLPAGHTQCVLCTPPRPILNNIYCPNRLVDHIRVMHTNFLPMRCPQEGCSLRFPTDSSLQCHIIEDHNIERPAAFAPPYNLRDLVRGSLAQVLAMACVLPEDKALQLLKDAQFHPRNIRNRSMGTF